MSASAVDRVIQESKGKVIEDVEWVEDGGYWVYTFTDGSEGRKQAVAIALSEARKSGAKIPKKKKKS